MTRLVAIRTLRSTMAARTRRPPPPVEDLPDAEDPTILGDAEEIEDPFEAALREVGRIGVEEAIGYGLGDDDRTDPETPFPEIETDHSLESGLPPPVGLEATLRVLEGPGRGESIVLPRLPVVVLGRSSRCDVPLRDLSVSRRHAELRWEEGSGYLLRDLGSRNGCAVDNVRVEGWTPVASGQVLAIGDVRLELTYGGGERPRDLDRPPRSSERSTRRSGDTGAPRRSSPRVGGAYARARDDLSSAADAVPLEADTYLGAYPARPERRVRPVAKAALGLGAGILIAGGLWLVLSALVPDPQAELPEVEPGTPGGEGAGRLEEAKAKIDLEAWDEAIAILTGPGGQAPKDPNARSLLALARRERRASRALAEGRAALDHRHYVTAIHRLHEIPRDSSYAPSAQAELDRAERLYVKPRLERARTLLAKGNARRALDKVIGPLLEVWPEHPEASALRDRASAMLARAPPSAPGAPEPSPSASTGARPTRGPRHRRTPRRGHARQASAADRRLLDDARGAFARGKVDSALSAAETAADLGVRGASKVAAKIRRYQKALREADATKQVARALGSYTDALYLAEEITPQGGAPARRLRKTLAQLHYIAALEEKKAGHVSNARRHLAKALSYDPGHKKARALQGRL